MADKLEGAEAQAAWLDDQGSYTSEDVATAIRLAGMTGNRYDLLRAAERSRLDRANAETRARDALRKGLGE